METEAAECKLYNSTVVRSQQLGHGIGPNHVTRNL